MKKLKVNWGFWIGLLLILAVLVIALLRPLPAFGLEEAEPPSWQPGDDEVVETTVGEMRVALWYEEQYKIVFAAANDFEEQARVAAANELKAVKVAETAKKQLGTYQALAVGGGALSLILLLVLLVTG